MSPEKEIKSSKKTQKNKIPSIYPKALEEAELLDFELAAGVDGIDDEIALLRVKIKALITKDPENIRQITQATNALARLGKTRYDITREQKKGFKDAIDNVLKDIALPLGIGIGTGIKGK